MYLMIVFSLRNRLYGARGVKKLFIICLDGGRSMRVHRLLARAREHELGRERRCPQEQQLLKLL